MKPQQPGRDWRRIHHSPIFWIGVVMCLAAIMIYVLSDDLSWRPGARWIRAAQKKPGLRSTP